MAFASANWSTLGASKSGNAPAMYTYISSADNLTAVKASGYFNTVEGLITTGDALWVVASNGQALCKLINTSGVITVTDLTT
jgi:hypothetical protein